MTQIYHLYLDYESKRRILILAGRGRYRKSLQNMVELLTHDMEAGIELTSASSIDTLLTIVRASEKHKQVRNTLCKLCSRIARSLNSCDFGLGLDL